MSNKKPLVIPPVSVGAESLSQLLAKFEIADWDILLVGDGSGSTDEYSCGWGCISIEKKTMERRLWYGSCNRGAVNFAEMMAYLPPLGYYMNQTIKSGKQYNQTNVHIITDAKYVAERSRLKRSGIHTRNSGIWQIFKQFDQGGFSLHWHWAQRETVELNHLADVISKLARISLDETALLEQAKNYGGLNAVNNLLYDLNPNTDL